MFFLCISSIIISKKVEDLGVLNSRINQNYKMEIPTATHATCVAHIQGLPAPTIVEDNEVTITKFNEFAKEDRGYEIQATEVFQEELDRTIRTKGIVITLILKTENDEMRFIIIPDNEFITELVNGKRLYFANSQGVSFFQMYINTQTIENVWQPTEN